MIKNLEIGQVLKTPNGRYCKVIAKRNGLYGLSDYTNEKSALAATVAYRWLNRFGLSGFTVVGGKRAKVKAKAVEVEDEFIDSQPKADDTITFTKTGLGKLKLSELQDLAVKAGVPAYGTKKELVGRILSAIKQ